MDTISELGPFGPEKSFGINHTPQENLYLVKNIIFKLEIWHWAMEF